MQLHCSYLICATPYNGSRLLGDALKKTDIAGRPEEYFEALKHTALAGQLAEYSQLDDDSNKLITWEVASYADYLAQVLEEGSSPNGVFGVEMMWSYFDDFICSLRYIPIYRDVPVRDLLPTVFPNLHYIWVTRRNKVQQAISLWQAFQRRTWNLDECPIRKLLFNFEVIDHFVQQIVADEADWKGYFDVRGIQPLIVVYEELVGAFETTVRNVLQYLQLPIPEKLVCTERHMERQADFLSEEWAQRYHHLKGEQFSMRTAY